MYRGREIQDFGGGNLIERNHLPVYEWKVILILIFRKYDGEVWKGLLRLRIGTDSGLL